MGKGRWNRELERLDLGLGGGDEGAGLDTEVSWCDCEIDFLSKEWTVATAACSAFLNPVGGCRSLQSQSSTLRVK